MADTPPKPQARLLGIDGVDDTKTPAHGIATPPYVQRKVDEVRAEAVTAATAAAQVQASVTAKATTLTELVKTRVASWIGAGLVSGVTLGCVAFAYDKLEDKAADAGSKAAQVQTNAVVEGLKGQEERVHTLEQQRSADLQQRASDRAEVNSRFEHLERQGNRIEEKMDAQLRAAGIPNPAPAPKDGGEHR